tara:strand:+ start:283755 stop:285548 length:1794 start_codon:yes stop_codon:yes gene_type:complete
MHRAREQFNNMNEKILNLMKLTQQQQDVLAYDQSCTVVGAPGSGKTTILCRKIEKLLNDGIPPKDIAVLTYSYRNLMVMRKSLSDVLGNKTKGIIQGTTVDLPLLAIRQTEKENVPKVADNNFVRRLLRQSMVEVGFTGHVKEAEHIMRAFKSRGRKPSETEENYDLFRAYKQRLEQTGLCDRHDLVRKHIIGMRNDTYEALAVKHIFIDNFQDVTQIQLLWLVDHLKAGVKVHAFGCDDLTLFRRDGAMGKAAFADFEELNDIKRFTFKETFRQPEALVGASMKFVEGQKDRLLTAPKAMRSGGAFSVIACGGAEQEMREIEKWIKRTTQSSANRVGIITRHDLQARQIERMLDRMGINHTSFARSIWETPGATLILDMLEVFLGKANNSRLRNVLSAFDVPSQAIDTLFTRGLMADTWLQRGAPMPAGIEGELPISAMRDLGSLRQKLLNYMRVIPSLGPKTVFKAMAAGLIERMNADDKPEALMALDELLTSNGNMLQILKQLTSHRTPDPAAQVVVSPVRETRNMAFTHVLVPFVTSQNYPFAFRVLPYEEDAERRFLYMATSRAQQEVVLTHCGKPSVYLDAFKSEVSSSAA